MIIADVDLELLRGKDRAFHEWLDWKLEQVRLEEREACAKVCEEMWAGGYGPSAITAAIRARGEK